MVIDYKTNLDVKCEVGCGKFGHGIQFCKFQNNLQSQSIPIIMLTIIQGKRIMIYQIINWKNC